MIRPASLNDPLPVGKLVLLFVALQVNLCSENVQFALLSQINSTDM